MTARQQDHLFRFGAVIKAVLDASENDVALIARSGLDLSRFGLRYSHAGVSLRHSPNTPWSVRQLYFACDERVPRLYDQGIAGFLQGTDDPSLGYVSVLLLPAAESQALGRVALDKANALALLGARYSANAYAFSQHYQNCNQWLVELLAAAWGPAAGMPLSRAAAQRWLQQQGYEPTAFDGRSPLLQLAALFMPWLHRDDHPATDQEAAVYRVSMPASIEAFVRARLPAARRIEFCHDERQVVVRHHGPPIADGCRPADGDTVIPFD